MTRARKTKIVQGFQGMPGSPGQQGPQGHQGYAGTQGDQGNQGLQGSQGGPGVQGNQGFQGAQGAQGFQGHQGYQGHQGFQGVQGHQGHQGSQGSQGTQGTAGAQGNQGHQGHQGTPSTVQGPQGLKGDQGNQGLKGDQGNQGAQGHQGNQGTQGVQGSQGSQGSQGNQGFQGEPGSGGSSNIMTVVADENNVSTIDLDDGNYFQLELEDLIDTIGTQSPGDITVVGTSSQSFGSSTTGTFTLPSNIADGDLIIVSVGSDGSTPALPSGWTNISNQSSGTEYTRTMYIVRASGSPATTVALSGMSTSSAAVAIALRGHHADIFDATTVVATGSTGLPNAGSITTQTNKALVIAIGLLDDDNVTLAAPSGYSNGVSQSSTTTGQTVALATKVVTTAGAEDPAAFTSGSGTDEWVAVTIAIKPAMITTYDDPVPPEVEIANAPTDVVSEIMIHLTTTSDDIVFPAGWDWNWKPDFSVYTEIFIRLLSEDGTNWNAFVDLPLDDFITKSAVASTAIDWKVGAIFTKTLGATTTLTFSNLQLNKVITFIVSGDYTLNLPAYCKKLSGVYDGTKTNYIQFHCTNAATGSEEVFYTIISVS